MDQIGFLDYRKLVILRIDVVSYFDWLKDFYFRVR